MYINRNFVDSVSLDRTKIKYPGYIGGFTRLLKEKHSLIIRQANEEPQFVVRNKSRGLLNFDPC
jgi:hypothetical protein